MSELIEEGRGYYRVPREGGMRVPGLIIASPDLLSHLDIEEPLKQVRNVAHLPGIVGASIGMPDLHWGYGFPIGGVAAMRIDGGVISPGGVGYDINCGVRLALLDLPFSTLSDSTCEKLLQGLFQLIPSGVGRGQRGGKELHLRDYTKICAQGARWSIEQGYGLEEDLAHCESYGVIEGGEAAACSEQARVRGRLQLGSIGSGNHFVEVGRVSEIYNPAIAQEWRVSQEQTYILIHSGSRGFGHQVCQDTLDSFLAAGFAKGLPDAQLVAAPIESREGKQYFKAMAAAANYAFNNRQQLLHEVRQVFHQVLGVKPEELRLLYDVAHNIAKFEEHLVEGKKQMLCVHRKGATRAFGPHHPELAPSFQKSGQPVLVPGDMQRASFLLAGSGESRTFSSCCHGAGRERSRFKSRKAWKGRNPVEAMRSHGVAVMATSYRTITEEMPDAYKNVEMVCEAVREAGLAKWVARFEPKLVIKG